MGFYARGNEWHCSPFQPGPSVSPSPTHLILTRRRSRDTPDYRSPSPRGCAIRSLAPLLWLAGTDSHTMQLLLLEDGGEGCGDSSDCLARSVRRGSRLLVPLILKYDNKNQKKNNNKKKVRMNEPDRYIYQVLSTKKKM